MKKRKQCDTNRQIGHKCKGHEKKVTVQVQKINIEREERRKEESMHGDVVSG